MNKVLANFIFCCLAICPCLSFAERDRSEAIIYPVGIRHLEYVDIQRHERPMVVDVYYPASISRNASNLFEVPFSTGFKVYKNAQIVFGGKKYPLILLSHGRSGNRFNLAWIAAYLASHGYIVGSMDHYSANSYNLSFEYVASKIWERPIDVSTHITHLLNHENWRKYIDGSRIGVAGHSQGGMTALWVGGAKINAEKFLNYQRGRRNDPVIPEYFKKRLPVDASPALNVHDKRVKAAFAMAPGAMKGFGFDKTGLKQLRIPTYLIAGAGDTVVPIKENAGFVAKYAPKAKLRIIPGPVGHEIFLNECDEEGKAEFPEACRDDPSVDRAKVHKLIADEALKFFDSHLKGL